ncbi:MAG: hypothetical protein KHY88_10480 [Erysipelotrichaceae bacterium]|nr:hypothetical protein [Erysipelotrichaceae bacterium]
MKYTIETATKIAHEMYVYESSEKADEKEMEYPFDGVWQSMYDVCQLVKAGILDDVEMEEYLEAKQFLIDTQSLTHDYQDFEMDL